MERKVLYCIVVWCLGTMGTAGGQQPPVPSGVKVLRDLAYVPGGHERQKLDLYLPEKASEPLPVIVWIHGGAWRGGDKNRCPGVGFTQRGFAVASIG